MKVAKTDNKVAKSVERFATFNIKVAETNNFLATRIKLIANRNKFIATSKSRYENTTINNK